MKFEIIHKNGSLIVAKTEQNYFEVMMSLLLFDNFIDAINCCNDFAGAKKMRTVSQNNSIAGSVRSEKKTFAARENGKKGGRPKRVK